MSATDYYAGHGYGLPNVLHAAGGSHSTAHFGVLKYWQILFLWIQKHKHN